MSSSPHTGNTSGNRPSSPFDYSLSDITGHANRRAGAKQVNDIFNRHLGVGWEDRLGNPRLFHPPLTSNTRTSSTTHTRFHPPIPIILSPSSPTDPIDSLPIFIRPTKPTSLHHYPKTPPIRHIFYPFPIFLFPTTSHTFTSTTTTSASRLPTTRHIIITTTTTDIFTHFPQQHA
ncbi:hypothetical protein MJO29_008410 [Puccinia striiformis f. sp. tritici]|nr:hypothetical protein MJO29_008410 [Puccinia striiformis f. sp. tritici]